MDPASVVLVATMYMPYLIALFRTTLPIPLATQARYHTATTTIASGIVVVVTVGTTTIGRLASATPCAIGGLVLTILLSVPGGAPGEARPDDFV